MRSSEHGALTKNQELVYDALTDAKGPLSAYAILDGLREHGIRAPLQVYRALDKLLEFGLVHRLESLNSFVACSHPECDSRETIAGQLQSLADLDHFALKAATVELRGFCQACQTASTQ